MRHHTARRGRLLCLALCAYVIAAAPGARAAEGAKWKLVEETWDAAYVGDAKQGYALHGYVHTTTEERGQGDDRLLRGNQELRLTFRRDGQAAQIRAEQGTEERPDGLVTAISFRTALGSKQEAKLSGRLVDKKMVVKSEVQNIPDRSLPWNPVVVGLVREQNLLRDRKVKSGDSFTYYTYQPAINNVATVKVAVKDVEETDIPGGQPRKLLRVELRPEALQISTDGGPPQKHLLPGSTLWVEPDTWKQVKSSNELPGVGTLVLVRTTKQVATAAPGKLVDFVAQQSIRLAEAIPGIHGANAVTYRFTLGNPDAKPAEVLKQDGRQRIVKAKGNTFDLHIEAVRGPRPLDPLAKRPEVGDEYRKSSKFITSADAKVQELAREAVGGKTDAWEKALAIESWVRQNMRPVDYSEALATADHVARTLSGDCTEYAMLTAAMCRAQKVPSRTAIGLVYVDHQRLGPILAFHMWTEVFVRGQWLAIDATRGQGSIGPGHIKITDHHWTGVEDFSPLLPVTTFILAKPSAEVISYRRSN